MVGAGATRSAVHNYTPGPQRVSLGGYRRVLYPIFHCYPVFKASSPCLSAEPTESTSERRLKRPPFGGPAERSHSVGRSTLCAPLDFQVVPRHQLEKYSTSPRGVKLIFRCSSKSQTGIAALADLEHLALELAARKREPLVAYDPPADPHGPALYKAACLAVRAREACEPDQVYNPDLLVVRQPDHRRIIWYFAAHDGIKELLGVGCGRLPVELAHQRAGQLTFLLDGLALLHRPVEQKGVVIVHQVVGDAHDLPEHLTRRLCYAYVVADGLAHLDLAVGADEKRGRNDALGSLPLVLHHLPAHEQVVELVCSSELDVSFYRDRIIGLHQRIKKLCQRDLVVRSVALAEVVALQDAGQGRRPGQPYEIRHRQRREPLGVVADLGPTAVEDYIRLLEVGPRVLLDLPRREDRTSLRTPGRVADACRVVSYHEYSGVPQVLEGTELPQYHSEAEMYVRGRGVYTQFYPQSLATSETAVELLTWDHIHGVPVDRLVLWRSLH